MPNYQILINAVINQANLQQQIKAIKPIVNIGVGVDPKATIAELDKIVAQIQSKVASSPINYKITTTFDPTTGEQIQRAYLSYKDSVGNIQRETYQWGLNQQKVAEWMKIGADYTKNTTKEIQVQAQTEKELTRQYVETEMRRIKAIEERNAAEINLGKQQVMARHENKAFNDKETQDYINSEMARIKAIEQRNAAEVNLGKQQVMARLQNKTFDNKETQDYINGEMKKIKAIEDRNAAEHKMGRTQLVAEKEYNGVLQQDIALQNKKRNQIESMQITLDKMQARAPEAFNTKSVQDQVTALGQLVNQYKAGKIPFADVETQLKRVGLEFDKTTTGMKNMSSGGLNLGNILQSVASKFLIWGVFMSTIYAAITDVKQAIQYLKDLDKVMRDTQIVTGATNDQIKELAVTYNKLGTELGSTTLEVAKGALEWQRAGYSAADTIKLLTASTMQATLGNMTAEESTDRLISTLHGYKLEAEDAMGVIDSLISLDNRYASSVEEISNAMSYGSSVAAEAGVSYQELASYITIVSATTRQSAETIGTAFPR